MAISKIPRPESVETNAPLRIGVAMSSVRRKNGLTQSDLADQIGAKIEEIKGIELGDVSLSSPTVGKVCDYFGESLDSFLEVSVDIMPTDSLEARRKLDSLFRDPTGD